MTAPDPRTQWSEKIAPDEAARHADYARAFALMQREKSEKFGTGRALHRHAILALRGSLQIASDLPDHARQGLFASPSNHDVWIRLSNGSAMRQPDARPDIRGFAFKVHGVSGDGALGAPTSVQDFVLINHEVFAFPSADEFVGLALAGSKGPRHLLSHLIKRYGFLGGLREARRLKRTFDQPFHGFAVESFFTAAPIACGPYAVKARLLPAARASAVDLRPGVSGDWKAAMARHLGAGPLRYQLQLQFFVNDQDTPIENPTIRWPEPVAPYVTVAELTIPSQSLEGDEASAFADEIEKATFDPWSALLAHRPLGEIMRARKVTYFESQQVRRST
jgi:hypothetical protein